MKKIFFSAYSLDIGGIETSLVRLLNALSNKYEITLCLEKKEGVFLDSINKNINVIEYTPNNSQNIIFRKVINTIRRIKFITKYRNKFDFSACYATYSLACNFVAKVASRNSCLWVHSDYLTIFNNDTKKMIDFFNCLGYKKYKNIVFVSNQSKTNFERVLKHNSLNVINNLIDYKYIIENSREEIDIKIEEKVTTFLNVGRHQEVSKKLTRLIEAAKKLKDENYKFKVVMVGDGEDNKQYTDLVNKYNLNDVFAFVGKQKNPYPYFKISDCIILTSDYEGYPVVYQEAFVLNVPIITTEVSDSKQDVENKYGIVVSKSIQEIYNAMKNFCEEGYNIKEKFDAEKFNKEQLTNIYKLIEK